MIFLLLLFTFPSTYCTKGIYRTKSADVEWLLGGRSILVLNVDAEVYRYEYSDTSVDYGSARIGIAYTPARWLETYTMWRAHGEGRAALPFDETDFTGDLGDVDLGWKMVLKKMRNSYLSTDFSATLPVGTGVYSNDKFIFYPKLLGTFDFGDHWSQFPLRAHLNVGSPLGRVGLSDNFPIMAALAFELPSKFFTFFMELGRNHERDWNWRLTPGFRFHPFYRFGLLIAADFGITEDYRLIGVNAGLSINSSLTKERETLPTGNIAGEIRDKNTNAPIGATVRVLEIDETEHTDKEYGVYKILGLPHGVYTLLIEAPNYAPKTRVVVVEPNRTSLSNFMLYRAAVSYEGIVLNMQTKQPVSAASINIEGNTTTQLMTDINGTFSEILIPGYYKIKINKLDYTQFVDEISIAEDHFDTIMMKPIEIVEEVPEAIVYFDLDDANIRSDQKQTIDQIGEFLKTHPRVNCELRGHTDPSGDIAYNQILSLARANSVKDYLVKVHGVEKERIATLAFSKTKLIKEKPEMSRRVEIFLIR